MDLGNRVCLSDVPRAALPITQNGQRRWMSRVLPFLCLFFMSHGKNDYHHQSITAAYVMPTSPSKFFVILLSTRFCC